MSSNSNSVEYDIIIVGGGLIGASLLLALTKIKTSRGLKIALIEPKTVSEPTGFTRVLDQRSLVLNLGSKLFYEKLDLWNILESLTTPINKIIVSEEGVFSKVFLDSERLKVQALGYVINIDSLNQNIWSNLNKNTNQNYHQINIISPYKVSDLLINNNNIELYLNQEKSLESKKILGKIIIGADGGRSYIRDLVKIKYTKYDYNQTAIIANVNHQLENKNIAYERFSSQGPFALLPRKSINDNLAKVTQATQEKYFSGIVWPWPNEELNKVKNLSKIELLEKLQRLFGYKLGKFLDIGEMQFFPLWRITSDQLFKNRVILLGNAANHIHPIGGQGFNLGLRDVKYFTDLIQNNIEDLINNNFDINLINQIYSQYSDLRADDHYMLQNSTHGLLSLFSSDKKIIKLARRTGMGVFNHSNFLVNLIAEKSMGLSV